MKKPFPPPHRRHLTKEDEALWEHTASSLKPLRAKKSRHHPSVEEAEDAPPFAPNAKPEKREEKKPAAARQASVPAPQAKASLTAPGLASFDRKAARKLRQGQFEIEARIDLHGMRQHEAHKALRRFLLSCFSRGLKWVLVITGKGAPRIRDEDGIMGAERGVLRRNVPLWLAEPELRAVVVSYTAAAIPHGGEGALYIQLRNPDRAR
ncbi:MAG: Smr/MutS family protein [Hyphomicrobium sp.]|uniref:Smr/MutS family protein n=1 Tax=Hyphomicrobium sp. TaxID=82 RepID=UPI003D14B836